jgi:hypothetical protein
MANSTSDFLPLDIKNYNVMIGRGRIRSLRVMPNTNCILQPQYRAKFANCYGPYQRGNSWFMTEQNNEAKESLGQKPPMTTYTTSENVDYDGEVSTYSPNGYMVTFGQNKTDALVELTRAKNHEIFDVATRAVFIDMNIANTNLQFYGALKIVFEISTAGKFKNRMHFVVLT